MCVRNEDLLDLAHLHVALLHLVLRRLPAVKKPYISATTESKREGRMVSGGRRLSGGGSEEGDVDVLQGHRGHCVGPRWGHRQNTPVSVGCADEKA